MLTAERRQRSSSRLDARRQGRRVRAGRGARRVRGHRPARPARARRRRGCVQRVHGGALPPAPPSRARSRERLEVSHEEKAALAEAAAAAARAARAWSCSTAGRPPSSSRAGCRASCDGTVLTNAPPVAAALADHPTRRGRPDRRPARSSGSRWPSGRPRSTPCARVRADACVLGVCALHPDVGRDDGRARGGARQARDGRVRRPR